jgi:hypothetical protein
MVDRLHDGPSQARVDQVNVNEAATEELDTFDVRH